MSNAKKNNDEKLFRYELHAHCSEVSRCGQSTAEEMVRAFAEKGFSGLVFTDHFIFGNTAIDRSLPWEERMQQQADAYQSAMALGNKLGITVLIGLEHHYGAGKELLIYGDISFALLAAHPEIERMDVRQFADFCHHNGWFVAQAHPFRERDYIDSRVQPIPEILDGVEVYNYCNRPEENDRALDFAKRHGLIPTSGSDTHSAALCGKAGVAFSAPIADGKQLAEALFAGQAHLIIDGEIADSL